MNNLRGCVIITNFLRHLGIILTANSKPRLEFRRLFLLATLILLVFNLRSAPNPDATAVIGEGYHYLSVQVPTTPVNLEIDAMPEGTFASIMRQITVYTNARSGLKLYISSTQDTTTLANSTTTSSPTITSAPFTDTPNILLANTWGFASPSGLIQGFNPISDYTNQTPTAKFLGIPKRSQPKLIFQGAASNGRNVTSLTIPIYYGFFVDSRVASGTHSIDVLYTAISESTDQSTPEVALDTPDRSFSLSGGETINLSFSMHSTALIDSSDLEVTIAGKPCTNPTFTQNPKYTYGKVSCTTPAQDSEGRKSLAIRIKSYNLTYSKDNAVIYASPINHFPSSLHYMQDMTPEICASVTTPTPLQTENYHVPEKVLIDKRDNQTYLIRKLADGKCWMTQNLRLKLDSNTALNNQTTDLQSQIAWTPTRTTEIFSSTGGSANQGVGQHRWDQDPEGVHTIRSAYRPDRYSADGVYYTHNAITAGSGASVSESNPTNATDSICPKGWRLPNADNNQSDFWKLADTYKGSAAWRSDQSALDGQHHLMNLPASFTFSGDVYYQSGSIHGISTNGYWWSSTVGYGNESYRLSQTPTHVNPRGSNARYYGFSARCVARSDIPFGNTGKMQDVTPEICSNQPVGSIKALQDSRDSQAYTIVKAKDGNCWMRQNLNLSLSTDRTLSPADTDIAAPYTPVRNTDSYSGNHPWALTDITRSRQAAPGNGVYYSWNTATAGTGTYQSPSGHIATGSLCPKGWKLPASSGNGSYYNLALYYPGADMSSGHVRLSLSGYHSYNGHIVEGGSTKGYFWSNQMIDLSNRKASSTSVGSSDFNSQTLDKVHYGFSVRCVLPTSKTLSQITYMQEMTAQVCATAKTHDTKTLIDARDNQSYTVKKMKNGTCWMMQDLNYKLQTTTKLRYGDSDLVQSWTPSRNTQPSNIGVTPWNGTEDDNNTSIRSHADDTSNTVFYNWAAATAGTGVSSFTATPAEPQKIAETSICPRGWQLPDYQSSKITSFSSLVSAYSGGIANPDINFSRHGYYSPGSGIVFGSGNSIYRWSNTTTPEISENRISAYAFSGNNSNQPRRYGFNVRCVARP